MAQTKSKMTIDEILAGIDERIELLGTIKAAVRYAFTDRYEGPDAEVEETPAPRPTRRKRAKHYAPRGQNKALLTQALQLGPMSTDGVYEWLNANGWQTTSANPRYLVAVTLRQMQKAGVVLRDETNGFWSLAPTQHTAETTPAQQVA